MKTRNLLAATAFAALLPTAAAFAGEAAPKPEKQVEKQLRCRIGNGKGASYARGPFECLKARAAGNKKIKFEIVDLPVKQEIATQEIATSTKDAPK